MKNNLDKLMGLDLGDATIGIALSDDLGMIAHPYETYRRESQKKDIDYLINLIVEKGIKKVILGMPYLMNQDIGEQAEKTLSFKKAFEKKLKYSNKIEREVILELQDERFTSKYADNLMRETNQNRKTRASKIDKIAASLILQTYMDIQKNKE